MTETVLNCGHCHKCGSKLSPVLDGEEWCDYCQTYRRYTSHGWAKNAADTQEPACPEYYGGGELIDLPPAKLAECFKDKTHQADVLFAIYRVVYPMWDEIEKVGGPDGGNRWPKCNDTTWKHIWRAFASFDEKHHPDVFKGGLWFNNGFSVDRTADIPDFKVMTVPFTIK